MRMVARKAMWAAAALLLMAGSASAAALFQPVPATPQEQARGADARAARQTMLSLDAAVLAEAIHDAAADQQADRASRSAARTGEVDIPLFAGRSVHVRRSAAVAEEGGGLIWSGSIDGGGNAILVVNHGTVAGFIESGGRQYLIDPAGGARHVLRDLKQSGFPRDRHLPRPAASRGSEEPAGPAEATAEATSYVDVLFAFTTAARNTMTSGGATVAQMIDRDVAIMNRGMAASGVPIRVRRAGIMAVTASYSENTADAVQPLYDLTSGANANFASIRSKRNSVRADLVAMYIRQNPINYCGVAWVNLPPTASYGYGVVDAYCLGTVTLAHELGHTMGLHHDRYVEPAASASAYNYGYVSTNGNFRDIMSYSDKCYAVLRRDCPVETYYSKPGKSINGVRAGIPKGSAGAADAARWLTEKAATVARFR